MYTQAREVILNYGVEQFKKALIEIQKIQNPAKSACRCKSCLYTAVNEMNYWIDFCEPFYPNNVMGYYDVMDYGGGLEIVFIYER